VVASSKIQKENAMKAKEQQHKKMKQQKEAEYQAMLNRGKSAPKQMPKVDGKYGMDDLLMQMSYDEHEGEEDEEDEDDDD
jgi:hypothetical protein